MTPNLRDQFIPTRLEFCAGTTAETRLYFCGPGRANDFLTDDAGEYLQTSYQDGSTLYRQAILATDRLMAIRSRA